MLSFSDPGLHIGSFWLPVLTNQTYFSKNTSVKITVREYIDFVLILVTFHFSVSLIYTKFSVSWLGSEL